MSKRIFDVLASSVALLLLFPLLIAIAVWVRLDSSGPVFFRQVRVGRYGKSFRIFKFRTMRTNAEKEGKLTIGSDHRITRSGHFLRRYKLDELPQLIDVLRGTMSLVGPRPEVPDYVECYPAELREKVLSVRPGITDYASIEMADENSVLSEYDDPQKAYIEIILPAKLKLYSDYVDSQSLVEDVKILFLTVKRILAK